MKGAVTWIGFTLAAVSAVWGGELSAAQQAPRARLPDTPKVGGEVEIANVPFDINEVIRTVRKNRGLPEELPKQGFHAEARGERPFVSKGNAFSHETPRFQAEVGENGLRYFTQGNKGQPDFEILSVRFERGGVPRRGRGKSQTVFGKNHLEEHAPGLLKGEARDGITSYIRNRGEEGVELYWVVEETVVRGQPSGIRERNNSLTDPWSLSPDDSQSPLQIIFTVRAAGEPREHPEGLVFTTSPPLSPSPSRERGRPKAGGEVYFSNVTVVDAAGRREKIRANVGRGLRPRRGGVTRLCEALRRSEVDPALQPYEIVFTISEKFLSSAQYPILIDPTVGPEFPVEPSPAIGLAAGDQWSSSVASNGTDYFVAWEDWRSGTDGDIYGARVASDGTVLDASGIVVSTAVDDQWDPSVASNGTDYFVAWSDYRSGVDEDIYGARVTSAAGTVLDPAGIAVSTEVDEQWYPSVASNGTDYFVAWEDRRSGTNNDIYGARVTSAGTVLDPSGIAVSTAVDDQWDPSVASNGTNYFIAWMDYRSGAEFDIYGARVTSAGTVLDPSGIAVSTAVDDQGIPSVASNGTNYFIAWMDYRSGAEFDIYGARVTSAGTVLDPSGIAVSTAADYQWFPSVASNGPDYFVAWEDWRSGTDGDIYGARIRASDGALLDGPPDTGGIAVSTAVGDQWFPSVASNGTDYFIAWMDYRSGAESDIYGARVTSAGTVLDPSGIAVSTVVNNQGDPSVASNGTDYFVVWMDDRSGAEFDVYGARVTSAGTVLDPAGIAVSTAVDDQWLPSVASNGTDYFVAWEDYRSGAESDIYGARVTSAGAVLDPAGIAVSTAVDEQWYPSVASNGTDYFVAWEDWRSGTDGDIYGTRIRASDGALLDGPPDTGGIAVSTAVDDQWFPSVASNGTDYFVTWYDWRSGTDWDVYGARVTSAGTVLDPAGIAVSTAANDQGIPSVASNGTGYFVAWSDYRGGPGNSDIYGARVTSAGTVLDPAGIAVSTAVDEQWYPSVASNGTDYFVTWEDYRSGTDWDIYGARVALDGTVLDPAGILIQQSLYDDYYPAVAYSSCGKYLVAHDRFHDDPSFQSWRVMAHLFYDGLQADADGDGLPDNCDICPAVPSVPSGCIPAGSTYPTDINCSGCVNGFDLITLGLSFGEFCGDPYYNADADLDASGAVDGADLDALIADFGGGCT